MSEQLLLRDRRGTNAMKWNRFDQFSSKGGDLLGLWVADMDFAAPECVRQAIVRAGEFGVFGYDAVPAAYNEAFIHWEKTYHDYEVKPEWIRFAPGVVTGFFWFIRLMTQPGDAVMILTPVYYPFMSAVQEQGRRLVKCELVNNGGLYTVDLNAFEDSIRRENVKCLLFCSPHNPVARVWTREELTAMLTICRRYGVKVISDEIHQDFEHPGHKHIPAASLGDYDDMLVTLTAPSKTFNLAGLKNSIAIIPDETLRKRYDELLEEIHIHGGNSIGFIAAAAAYSGGRPWLEQVLAAVEENDAVIRRRLAEELPEAIVSPLEGTYLQWVDLGAYVTPENIKSSMEELCGLALDYGTQFGGDAPCHIRINLGTSREIIEAAAERLLRLKR